MSSIKNTPPRLFLRFFRWYCHPKLKNYIEGDLMELYREKRDAGGKWKADVKFAIDVLLLFRPGIIRPAEGYKNLNTYGMYRSYLKIGWRNLLRHKGYSFINIGGLAMGMAVAIMIGLWIHDELEFNKYHKNYNSIAQVIKNVSRNGEILSRPYLPNSLGDELKSAYGNNFKHVVMAYPVEDHFLSAGENKLSMRGEFMEPDGPEMFSLNMLQGSWSGLNDLHSILLSQSVAKALFGEEDAMDKHVKINNTMDAKVTGIYEDLPHNTHFHDVKFFAPLDLLVSSEPWMKEPGFTNNFLHIYVTIGNHTDFESASGQISNAILNNIRDDKGYTTLNPQIFLHPMEKWHLYPEWKNGVSTGDRVQIVWLFGFIGAFVLLLACINFMNLSTARSEKRAKEVGLRKAIGSRRTQLMHQFFSESFLVVVLAFAVALVLVSGSLNWFNMLAGKQMKMPWTSSYFWLSSIAFLLSTGLLAGSYPALYLSSFNPVSVLKGSLRVGRLALIPRKILVVVQFTVSVTLIIGTIMVYRQIQFAKDRPVGYTRNGLLMIPMTSPDFYGKQEALSVELKNTGAVVEVAQSSSPPTDVWTSNGGFDWKGKDPAFAPNFATLAVTAEYGKTVGWQFVNGRDFSGDRASDSAAFVINEAAAKVFGFENPVGEIVQWSSWRSKATRFTIIGVINDMVLTSPYAPQMPAVFFLSPESQHFINIRLNANISAGVALPRIESVFKKIIPSAPFDFKFVDQEYALKFTAEERIGKLALVFAVLTILISCLGLFGLASFVAEQRTKEIGIRKVVGATVFSLWKMLSKEFMLLVTVSFILAIPLSYYAVLNWLEKYDYRTEVSWWVFAITGIGALVITILTVSYQAIKAALMNPVKSLRSE